MGSFAAKQSPINLILSFVPWLFTLHFSLSSVRYTKTAGAYTELIGIGPELVQTQLAIFNLAL
jgi:hypothetical protein